MKLLSASFPSVPHKACFLHSKCHHVLQHFLVTSSRLPVRQGTQAAVMGHRVFIVGFSSVTSTHSPLAEDS